MDTKRPEQFTSRQVKWQQKLSHFGVNQNWEYRKGSLNVADPLSRNPAWCMTVAAPIFAPDVPATDVSFELLNRIKHGYVEDPYYANEKNVARFVHKDHLYMHKSMIVVPDVGDLRHDIIALYHDPPFAGHLGRDKTQHSVMRQFWWPGLGLDVAQFVSSCDLCQRTKASNQSPAGLLQPLEIPKRRWHSVSCDLITHLPLTRDGHTAIVVFC